MYSVIHVFQQLTEYRFKPGMTDFSTVIATGPVPWYMTGYDKLSLCHVMNGPLCQHLAGPFQGRSTNYQQVKVEIKLASFLL
jgi:hypothetical protein